MAPYRYSIHKKNTRPEGLGALELPDDAEAIVFGKQVIRVVIWGRACTQSRECWRVTGSI